MKRLLVTQGSKLARLAALLLPAVAGATTIIQDPACRVACTYTVSQYANSEMQAGLFTTGPMSSTYIQTGPISDHDAAAVLGLSLNYGLHVLAQAQSDACFGPPSACNGNGGIGPFPDGAYYYQAYVSANLEQHDYIYAPNARTGSHLQMWFSYDATGYSAETTAQPYSGVDTENSYTTYFGASTPTRLLQCIGAPPSFSQITGGVSGACEYWVGLDSHNATTFYYGLGATAGAVDGVAFINALHTAAITSVQLVDANGDVIPDAVLYDGTGWDYNNLPSDTVPEPGKLGLVGALVVGLFLVPRKRSTIG